MKLGTIINGELFLSTDDRRRHLFIVGKSGTGKSTLLQNLIRQQAGGFAVLDPHGDLAETIVDCGFPGREVIYLDAADLSHSVAYNPLEDIAPDDRPLVAAQVVATFKHIWGESWGFRLEYILLNSLRLLLDAPGTTLLGLPRLLVDDRYRAKLLKNCADPVVRSFWSEEFDNYDDRFRREAISPIQNKIGALLSPPCIRNILGQARSTLDISRIMNEGQVLICNLSKGRIGEGPSHLLGALITTAFAQAAEGRARIREQDRLDFVLYVDEFQNFATDSFATILSEARKYRLSLVLGNQFLGQIPSLLRQAVFGNVGTLIAFRVGAEDAFALAAELGVHNPETLTDTPNFQAWIKLIRAGVPLEPHFLSTIPPSPSDGRFPAVRRRTYDRHSRPRVVVEAEIARFLA